MPYEDSSESRRHSSINNPVETAPETTPYEDSSESRRHSSINNPVETALETMPYEDSSESRRHSSINNPVETAPETMPYEDSSESRRHSSINNPVETAPETMPYEDSSESRRHSSIDDAIDVGPDIYYGVRRGNRRRRSTNTDIVIKLGPTVTTYEVTNLDKGVEYCITMYAHNPSGDGVHSTCTNKKTLLTDDIIPVIVQLQAAPSSIIVTLNVTNFNYSSSCGFLKSFDLEFKVIRSNGAPVYEGVVIKKFINATTLVFNLDGFDVYTTYEVKAAAVTRNGRGPYTGPAYIETCHCRPTFYTNWFIQPPFTNLKANSQAGGIFPLILNDIIQTTCKGCELGNGTSTIDYVYDLSGDQSSLKPNRSMMKGNVMLSVDISFPFNSKNKEINYKGTYIPMLHVPGLLLVSRNESLVERYARVVMGSIVDIWPIVVCNVVMLLLAGTILWTLERQSNSEQFPVPALKGVPEGAWWSFVTMTTIGYGDRYPITVLGRIFAIIWALVGITMSSIMVGAICSTLTTTIVQELITGVPRGITIGAIADTPDYEVAVEVGRTGGSQVQSFSHLEEMVLALKSKEIDSIVLDPFTANSRTDLFNGTWYKVTDVVGKSFSYGVLLNGQAARLERHFKQYIAANISKVLDLASTGHKPIDYKKNETKKEPKVLVIINEPVNFLDPNSSIFQNLLLVFGLMLLGLCLIGLAYHFHIYRKRNEMTAELKDQYRDKITDMKSTLEEFHSNFCYLNSKFRKCIIKDLRQKAATCLKDERDFQEETPKFPVRHPLYQMRKSSLYNSEVEF